MNRIRQLVLFIIFISIANYVFCQDTLKLYYNISEYTISPKNKPRLDSLNSLLSNNAVISVKAYTDHLGSKAYNIQLSNDRANAVRNYFQAFRKAYMVTWEGKGEAPSKKKKNKILGEPINRRVDIIAKKYGDTAAKLNEAPKSFAIPEKDTTSFKNKVNKLSEIGVGESISLPELTFQAGKHYLNNSAEPYLEILLTYLKTHDNLKFDIVGHVCCVPGYTDGIDMDTRGSELSVNRARVIYQYFIKNGIAEGRMSFRGVGGSRPKVPEINEAARIQNRRVEIVVVGK